MLHIPMLANKSLEKKNWKMLQNNWFIRQLCVHQDMKHLESLESIQEARVALGYASSDSYASFMLSNFPHASDLDECMLTYEPIVNNN